MAAMFSLPEEGKGEAASPPAEIQGASPRKLSTSKEFLGARHFWSP